VKTKVKKSEIELVQTCEACPEQYNAFLNGIKVGYLRLRHGCFTVQCPDVGGEQVYSAFTEGDGMFINGERDKYLRKAVKAIKKRISVG
jgi:hypothetical protein